MEQKHYQITLDGPSASGKEAVALRLAKRLNFIHVDSGKIYRGISSILLSEKIIDKNFIEKLEKNHELLKEPCDKNIVKFLNNTNLDLDIIDSKNTGEEIGRVASLLSNFSFIREKVNTILYTIAKSNNIIVDGRDMGTEVFKDAIVKIYLNASLKERARRRAKQTNQDIDLIEEKLTKRDYMDKNRKIAPLRKAADSIVIENDNISIEKQVEFITGLFIKRKNDLPNKD